jgi:hypothetical protein
MVPRMVPTALRTLLLWLLPRVITTLLLTALPRRCQPYCEAGATVLLTVLLTQKKLASRVALLACRGGRPNLCDCVWLAVVAGLLIRRSGCRAGQRGDAGTSPDCFPGGVSSLAVSVSGWPRILPVRLESSFLRWRCAVRVNGMENLLLAAAGHCPPKP